MTECLADSFYWLAVVNPQDAYHKATVEFKPPGRVVTTWPVIIEVMDALCAEKFRGLATRFWTACREDPDLVVIPLTSDLMDRAAALYGSRHDKNWSLTDCISFVVMEDRQIRDALTRDRHFEQAGFVALLRDNNPTGS